MSESPSLRDEGLFGCLPLEFMVSADQGTRPWKLFREADESLKRGDGAAARAALEEITAMDGSSSRDRIQAWGFLREMGVHPPEGVEKDVLGVIVEVGMEAGQDVLAVYADKTAQYYNYSGAGVVWKHPDSSLDSLVERVLESAGTLVRPIRPWQGHRRRPVSKGQLRLSVLTPLGLHFGEGPFGVLDRDPLARPLVQATTNLMVRLTSLPPASDSEP